MPKETVFGEQFAPVEEQGGTPSVPVAEVRWSRNGGPVQIVTRAEDPHGGRLTDYEGVHYTDGFHVDLSRTTINQLIRNLRRARDQAFGRDE